jgi:hypothetical protein
MNPANAPWIYKHHFPSGPPRADLCLDDSAPPGKSDVEICRRLIRAYLAAKTSRARTFSADLWDEVQAKTSASIDALAEREDASSLATALQNGIRSDFSFGLGSGPSWYSLARTGGKDVVTTVIVDRLVSLAEYLGVIPLENPETETFGVNGYHDLTDLLHPIEARLGSTIGAPRAFGLFGVLVDGRLLTLRTPDALYASHRLLQLGDSVLEIGAGFGLAAYHFARASQADRAANYTILDLPFTNLLQGYFLLKSLDPAVVRLFGEEFTGQRISVLPYFCADQLPATSIDVVFSQDVLPELSSDKIDFYLDCFRRVGRSWFYTINHEGMYAPRGYATDNFPDRAGFNISERIKAENFLRVHTRAPYWIRKGYVEELYELRQQ